MSAVAQRVVHLSAAVGTEGGRTPDGAVKHIFYGRAVLTVQIFRDDHQLIRLTDDPDVLDPLRFLREREIVHFQRFGETLERVMDGLDPSNPYACNPSFDRKQ